MHQSNFMAYRIQDIYSFEQFPSMAEFLINLEKNQWKRHNPKKKVSVKGKRSLTIDYKNKSIFVKLDFSMILREQYLVQLDIQRRDFETLKFKNSSGKNEPSCFVSINDSDDKYTIQSILFVKDTGGESEKILFVTTVLDMENRFKEIGRGRKPADRQSRQSGNDWADDDDWDDDDDDDDDWDDEGYGGRPPADDRSDSMNPESPRYNPTSRR